MMGVWNTMPIGAVAGLGDVQQADVHFLKFDFV